MEGVLAIRRRIRRGEDRTADQILAAGWSDVNFTPVSGSDIVCRGAGFFKMSFERDLRLVSALLEDRDLWTFDWFLWNVGADDG
jgi:hypothetical protein